MQGSNLPNPMQNTVLLMLCRMCNVHNTTSDSCLIGPFSTGWPPKVAIWELLEQRFQDSDALPAVQPTVSQHRRNVISKAYTRNAP